MSHPRILGLTGSIGMGKSTVAEMFERAGVPVYAPEKGVQSDGGEAVASPGLTTGDPVIAAAQAEQGLALDPGWRPRLEEVRRLGLAAGQHRRSRSVRGPTWDDDRGRRRGARAMNRGPRWNIQCNLNHRGCAWICSLSSEQVGARTGVSWRLRQTALENHIQTKPQSPGISPRKDGAGRGAVTVIETHNG